MNAASVEREDLLASLPTHVESGTLLLRRYLPSDAFTLAEVYRANRERLKEDFPNRIERVVDAESAEAFIWERAQMWEKCDAFHFGIWNKTSKLYAGEVCFKNLVWSVPKADIGYYVVQEYEGKGLMSASVRLLLPFAFEHLRIEKLQLRCSTENVASRRVAERCGFMLEGVLRNDVARGEHRTLVDLAYYGMTPEDYRKLLKPPGEGGFSKCPSN